MSHWNIINLWIDDDNKTKIAPHSHNWNEIIYLKKGKVQSQIGDKSYDLEEGSFVIIPKKTRHDEIRKSETHTLCLIFTCEDEVDFGLFTDKSGEILAHLLSMNKEARAKPYKYRKILQLKLDELYVMIERIKISGKDNLKDFGYALNYINDNSDQKIKFPALAKKLNMSYSNFRHRFREVAGISPKGYLIRCRLEKSKKLLLKDELNCTEIAYCCGFSNSAQFTDMFKSRYGITPKQYRKKFKL